MQLLELIQQSILSLAIALFLVYCTSLPRRSLFFSGMLFLLLLIGENSIALHRGSSLVELARGAIGDVSFTSGVLAVLIIGNQLIPAERRRLVLARSERLFLFGLGSLLYLSTFGFIQFDLYHYGYLKLTMLLSLAFIVLCLLIFDRRLGYAWLCALIAYYYHWQASNNLWDYLYDPVLWIVLGVDNLAYCLQKFKLPASANKTSWS